MIYQTGILAIGLLVAGTGIAIAKPPGGPTNPHCTGKEPTTIEREFHLPTEAEPRLTDPVPTLPAKRIQGEVIDMLRLALPWLKGL